MGRELGLHDVAALPAELDGFHVLHRTISQLASDDQVGHGHDREKHAGATPRGFTVDRRAEAPAALRLPSAMPIGIRISPAKNTTGDGDEHQQTDVGIADIPANVRPAAQRARRSPPA